MVCGGYKSNAIRDCDDNLMRKNVKKIFFFIAVCSRKNFFLEEFYSHFLC